MLNDVTLRLLKRQIEKGNSVAYICYSLGIARTTVYRIIGEGVDNYIERRRQNKKPTGSPAGGTHYKKALPPEKWKGAETFLVMMQRVKDLRVKNPTVDLDRLRSVWQKKMEEVVN